MAFRHPIIFIQPVSGKDKMKTKHTVEAQVHQLNSIGYITARLAPESLQSVWDEVNHISKSFRSATPYNHSLAGNIEHEYELKECVSDVFDIVDPFVEAMNEIFHHDKDYQLMDKACPYMMQSLWVNFQKRYEFNPAHHHSGVYSFVIWLKVPYKIEDEIDRASSRNARMRCPAHFQFSYTDSLGQISQELIPVDETYENVLCIFPSRMIHQVYPFYTAEDYRISIAGNIGLKAGDFHVVD